MKDDAWKAHLEDPKALRRSGKPYNGAPGYSLAGSPAVINRSYTTYPGTVAGATEGAVRTGTDWIVGRSGFLETQSGKGKDYDGEKEFAMRSSHSSLSCQCLRSIPERSKF